MDHSYLRTEVDKPSFFAADCCPISDPLESILLKKTAVYYLSQMQKRGHFQKVLFVYHRIECIESLTQMESGY